MVDTTAYRYKVELVNKVGDKFGALKETCNLLEAPLPSITTVKPKTVYKDAKDFSFFNFNTKVKS